MSKKVFLGVGHGGKDPGAVADGYQEKDITLTMALACKKELERHGVTVGISRTKDEDDPLSEEIKECNAFAPDLAVDIHVNAGGGDGFEVFHTLSGGVGKQLSQNIEAEVKLLGQNSRGLKTKANSAGKDYFGFIREITCPAVICEIGFIDNAADRAGFDTKEKQEAFAKAYAKGILTTLGIKHLPEESAAVSGPATPAAPKVHWAQAAYDSLNKKGITIHETRFDDPITRGEVFALLDQIVG